MPHILSGIHTQDQHIQTWLEDIDQYRPSLCPCCGKTGLWSHGVYFRRARVRSDEKGTTPIPRFFCPHCKRTCSTLPQYLPPRRWYQWLTQQLALQLSLMGRSLMQVWQALHDKLEEVPSLSTLQRWFSRHKQRFSLHQFHLLNAYPVLGYSPEFTGLWQACLDIMPLSGAMVLLNRHLNVIP